MSDVVNTTDFAEQEEAERLRMEQERQALFDAQVQAMYQTSQSTMPMTEPPALPENIVYKVEDNRLWSTEKAKFVKRTPANATVIELMKDGQLADNAYLRETLTHYGFEIGDELLTLDEVKANRLNQLKNDFAAAEATGVVASSVGFIIDANERANRDINGLIDTMADDATVMFCAADNSMHSVTKADLITMRNEIVAKGQELYATKWVARSAIEAASSVEEINQVTWQF